MDCLHVHQVLKLLHALVGHAGPPGNQFLIVLDFCLASLTADQQVIILPPLIGKLDVKSKFPVKDLLKIYLAHIIPACIYMLEFYRLA